ncbi:cache domain-containing protein [Halovenus rubra]|uniref:Cache domain-containing protein n=2 Tax=Halovenus rubra TaxID=869890 RepID=A0ACC7E3R4_9EURY
MSGGVLFATFDSHRSDVTENAEASAESRAATMAKYLDNELQEQQQVLELFKQSELAQTVTTPSTVDLEPFVETTAFDGISVVNKSGAIQSLMTSSGPEPDVVGNDLSSRMYVKKALAGEKYISKPFVADTGNHIIVMSTPIRINGSIQGTLNGAYHIEKANLFDILVNEDNATATTVEAGGKGLYSTVGEQEETISTSVELKTVNWTLTAHYDRAVVEQSVRRLAIFQGVLGLVLFGTLVTFGWWVYRSQVLQIGRVLNYLDALTRRKYNYQSRLSGGSEWNQIESSLTRLRDELSQREQMLVVHNRILRHNLRNKLNVIRSHNSLLKRNSDVSTEERTAAIEQATDDLLELADRARTTEQLLDPTDTQELRTDMVPLIRERAEKIQQDETELSVEVVTPCSAYAACDSDISSAIDELLQNVVDHGGPEANATVTVSSADGHVIIRIEDDGDGIPEREMQIINGDENITQLRHTVGIGLWLVEWIVRRYDGVFRVPEQSRGLVEITLPCASAPEDVEPTD